MVYKIKTNINDASVVKFLNTIENEQKRNDSFEILEIMQIITGDEPKMWGSFSSHRHTSHRLSCKSVLALSYLPSTE